VATFAHVRGTIDQIRGRRAGGRLVEGRW
jgi:hypothetical protein